MATVLLFYLVKPPLLMYRKWLLVHVLPFYVVKSTFFDISEVATSARTAVLRSKIFFDVFQMATILPSYVVKAPFMYQKWLPYSHFT